MLLAAACQAQERNIKRENTEWTDVWFPNSNDHDLPRVALIGDSITRAYSAAVESNLKGKAYCARIATSKAVGDPALPVHLSVRLSGSFTRSSTFSNAGQPPCSRAVSLPRRSSFGLTLRYLLPSTTSSPNCPPR